MLNCISFLQEEQPGEKVEKLSKKKLKLKNRMSVAELKQVIGKYLALIFQ